MTATGGYGRFEGWFAGHGGSISLRKCRDFVVHGHGVAVDQEIALMAAVSLALKVSGIGMYPAWSRPF